MRLTLIILLFLLQISAVQAADRQPTVDELIKRAIASLENSSYEGRMRYSDLQDDGEVKLVQITYAAPARFRVQPMISEKQMAGYFFIENSERLVKIFSDGKSVVEMPERQFIIDNLMRRRLLETMAGRPSVSLLRGVFNAEPVWILRDDGRSDDEFSITIHISERNDYPVSLQTNAADGRRMQFYELEDIRFLTAAEITPDLFEIPPITGRDEAPHNGRPHFAEVIIPAPNKAQDRDSEGQQLQYKPGTARSAAGAAADAASGAEAEEAFQQIPYPLIPQWLPKGYMLNAISPLDYSEAEMPMLVYQLELYNPFTDNVISVFETRSQELEDLFKAGKQVGETGYFVASSDEGWLVAVFGSISQSQFDQIFDNLERDDDMAYEVISRTLSREELRRWAEDVCTRDGNPVP